MWGVLVGFISMAIGLNIGLVEGLWLCPGFKATSDGEQYQETLGGPEGSQTQTPWVTFKIRVGKAEEHLYI